MTSDELLAQFQREIARRQQYIKQLQGLTPFLDRDGWKRNQVEGERQRLKLAIDTIADWLIMTAHEHFPAIALVPDNRELSMSHIMEALSAMEISSRMMHTSASGQ